MREAWSSDVEAVVVAGGDGSVNCAAGVAAGSEMVLGVLPMGTFNHFAKDLGMPTDGIASSVSWLARAHPLSVDIGEVNGKVFVNNASIGVYPKMVADREAIRSDRGWGKIRAAPVAIARTLRHLPVHRLRVSVDETSPAEVSTPFLFVGNGSFDDHGQRVGRRTSLTDHRLGVYCITTSRRWPLIVNAIRSRVSGIASTPRMQRRLGEKMVVDSDDVRLAIALDGEPTELRVPLTFRSRAGALRVLAAPDES
jgi:diacylglycerol kinase family enzyme